MLGQYQDDLPGEMIRPPTSSISSASTWTLLPPAGGTADLPPGVWNQVDYGRSKVIYAGNAVAIHGYRGKPACATPDGHTVVWKPSDRPPPILAYL